MEYAELKDQIKALQGDDFRRLRMAGPLFAPGGTVSPDYAEMLAESRDCMEFFERVYNNDALRLEYAWGQIALSLHPDDWIDRFQADAIVRDIPLENNALIMTKPDGTGHFPITLEEPAEAANLYIFHDGALNSRILTNARRFVGHGLCAGQELKGQATVYVKGNHIIFIFWVYDDAGRPLNLLGDCGPKG